MESSCQFASTLIRTLSFTNIRPTYSRQSAVEYTAAEIGHLIS